MSEKAELLLELGVEELPASFVDVALAALPTLAEKRLNECRLTYDSINVYGTPRRLALQVQGLATQQPNLEEEVTGPPVRAAFKDGVPTKAGEAFANKLGTTVDALRRVETSKGEYLVGTRKETGRPAKELLPELLGHLTSAIPFRKSMRWGAQDYAFGRPIQWIVALFGSEVLELEIAGIKSGRATLGHRFLAPEARDIPTAGAYIETLAEGRVMVVPEQRKDEMRQALIAAAEGLKGKLIEDEFLMAENAGMVELGHVIVGGFDREFLELPANVILEVAKGHQRYFGIRDAEGALMPNYLAVANTARNPENIRRGNDRVMRARLADAQFFYREDLRVPLADRREKLAGIVFQKRLGSVLEKAERIERLAKELGLLLQLPERTLMAAASGAHLCKCDLVSLMVGEFPELEGEMGAAYAKAQGVDGEVCDVIHQHYLPRGASSPTATSDAAALVAIADRLDTLVGCFGIGLTPTGAADPYALRRACLGILRTIIDHNFALSLSDAFRAAADGYTQSGKKLDLTTDEVVSKVGDFAAERLRGLLGDGLPNDTVAASLAVAADRPIDARARAQALAGLNADTRAQVGEVFKRATNIAVKAPSGDPVAPKAGAHESEVKGYEAFVAMRERLQSLTEASDYAGALKDIAAFAPLMSQYFVDVLVMDPDEKIRDNRLRLMRAISDSCAAIAKLELLGQA